jgi:redox-sensitive bicupin YhaK (pirin superfamily)
MEMQMKRILNIKKAPAQHWVGDGFPVRSILSHYEDGLAISPFLLLDYAAPFEFPPSSEPRGVDEHPHKGFETVTIVYQGELEHRDSTGEWGKIGPGDVQWMTAGAGIVHEEKHSRAFTESGGTFEVAQLWVNLPAKHKLSPPGYQTLLKDEIPTVQLDGGTARVVAGSFNGTAGPSKTFTPVNVWDVRLNAGARVQLPAPESHSVTIIVLHGEVVLDGEETVSESERVLFSRDGAGLTVESKTDATLLVLTGEPIDEPIAAYGPFVMNTEDEIRMAITEYRNGKMGHIHPVVA